MSELVPIQVIENKIYSIRGKKVMLDSDLSELYEVQTKVLNQAVKRNIDRFPEDFMFQITDEEWEILKSQFVTSSWGGKRKLPQVFTEYGILMLSSVLNSEKAIQVNIQIIRIFSKLREIALINKETAQRLDELEKTVIMLAKDTKTDIQEIFRQLRNLTEITKPEKPKHIGFKTK